MTNVLQFPWIKIYFKPHRMFFEDAVSLSMSLSMTMWIAWSYNRLSVMNTLVRPIKLPFPSYVESTWLCAFCSECVIHSVHNKLVRRFRAATWSSKEQFITSEKTAHKNISITVYKQPRTLPSFVTSDTSTPGALPAKF